MWNINFIDTLITSMYEPTNSSTIVLSLLTQKNGIPTHKIAHPNSKLLTCRSVHKNLNIQALIDQNAKDVVHKIDHSNPYIISPHHHHNHRRHHHHHHHHHPHHHHSHSMNLTPVLVEGD